MLIILLLIAITGFSNSSYEDNKNKNKKNKRVQHSTSWWDSLGLDDQEYLWKKYK